MGSSYLLGMESRFCQMGKFWMRMAVTAVQQRERANATDRRAEKWFTEGEL